MREIYAPPGADLQTAQKDRIKTTAFAWFSVTILHAAWYNIANMKKNALCLKVVI